MARVEDLLSERPVIETPRLRLVPASRELALAELEGRPALAALLQADVPASWPPPLNDEQTVRWTLDKLEKEPEAAGWLAYYVLLEGEKGRPTAIGIAGFQGPPDDEGTVEVGFAIVEDRQRMGYATETTRALVEWAFRHPEVLRVEGYTLPDLKPSIRVLERSGFRRDGKGKGENKKALRYVRERS